MKYLKLFENWKSQDYVFESISTARSRFLSTQKVTEEEFEEALDLDMSPNKKYIEKILDLYVKGKDDQEESLTKIGALIKKFDMLVSRNKISNSDINSYKTFKELKNSVENAEIEEVEKEATDLKSGDFTIIKDNKDLLVVVPNSHTASQEWGYDTNWCTTSSSDTYWKDYVYSRDVNLFYIMVKNTSLIEDWYESEYGEIPDSSDIEIYTKMAVAVYPYSDRYECFDKKDNSIEFDTVSAITGLGSETFEWEEIEKPYWYWVLSEYELESRNASENEDGTIDFDGDVWVPQYVDPSESTLGDFNKISGDFLFENPRGYEINSIKDCRLPKEIGYNFTFTNTNIENLVGSPETVGNDFDVSDNPNLVSIEGAPKHIEGNFIYKGTPLSNSRNSMIRMTAQDIREIIKVDGLIINDLGEWHEGESDTKPFYHPSQISLFNEED